MPAPWVLRPLSVPRRSLRVKRTAWFLRPAATACTSCSESTSPLFLFSNARGKNLSGHRRLRVRIVAHRDSSIEPPPSPGGETNRGGSFRIPVSRPLARPAAANGLAFVGGRFGSYDFYAFHPTAGEPRWTVRTEDHGPAAATAAEGNVLFGTGDGTLYCFNAGDTDPSGWPMWGGGPGHNGTNGVG